MCVVSESEWNRRHRYCMMCAGVDVDFKSFTLSKVTTNVENHEKEPKY